LVQLADKPLENLATLILSVAVLADMEEMESVPYITDIANPWVSGAALFFISNRSVGKRGNTSFVVGHCIL
jgi:hypothetical protein